MYLPAEQFPSQQQRSTAWPEVNGGSSDQHHLLQNEGNKAFVYGIPEARRMLNINFIVTLLNELGFVHPLRLEIVPNNLIHTLKIHPLVSCNPVYTLYSYPPLFSSSTLTGEVFFHLYSSTSAEPANLKYFPLIFQMGAFALLWMNVWGSESDTAPHVCLLRRSWSCRVLPELPTWFGTASRPAWTPPMSTSLTTAWNSSTASSSRLAKWVWTFAGGYSSHAARLQGKQRFIPNHGLF